MEAFSAMSDNDEMTLVFRCPAELMGMLPPPYAAVEGLPDWFKAMPQKAFNAVSQSESQTVKRCPPFIDAMTYGFLIPLPCDVTVKDGEFSWEFDLPVNSVDNFTRSPIAFHDPSQVAGTPFHQGDRFAIKFNNFWSIEAPPNYSLLITHPVNRTDLPFTTLTGLVDSDLYRKIASLPRPCINRAVPSNCIAGRFPALPWSTSAARRSASRGRPAWIAAAAFCKASSLGR